MVTMEEAGQRERGAPPPYATSDPSIQPAIREAVVRAQCGQPTGPLRRIWTSFGYDEINWTYTPRGKRALRTIGDLAEQPYFVRSHYERPTIGR
jgi:xylan 1,4-beta-xylosidase